MCIKVGWWNNSRILIVTSKEIGLEVNADKTKYMVMSRDQKAGRSHSIENDDSSYEMLEDCGCGNNLKEWKFCEIKSRLNSKNTCSHWVQNIFSSHLLAKNMEIMVYRTIILPVVWCGCESWSLTMREESRIRMSENRVLRRIFGPTRDKVTGKWRRLHYEELYDLYSSP